jgi:serine/threonine protein kinase
MAGEGVVDFDNYRVLLAKELGRGTFGSVYEGVHIRTKTKVAVKKMMIKSSLHGAEGMKEIKLLHR